MKVIFPLMIFLLLVSCNKKSDENFPEYETQKELNERITVGKPFFDFDEVLYYHIPSSKNENNRNESTILTKLLFSSYPKKEDEELFFTKGLDSIKKFEKTIDAKFIKELKYEIFSEKKCKGIATSACDPAYRDIFIFKKNKRNIGMSKICFECEMFTFSESKAITNCFNMNNELNRLKIILKENK